ncbi:IS30 family transposase, partial [Streptomyces sp. NPDC055990]
MEFEIREIRVAQGRKKLLRERETYFQLMQQGLSNNQACRIVGINAKTGRRWRNGRSADTKRRVAPPVRP